MGSLQFSTLSMSTRCTTHNGCNTAPTRGGSEKCMVGGGAGRTKNVTTSWFLRISHKVVIWCDKFLPPIFAEFPIWPHFLCPNMSEHDPSHPPSEPFLQDSMSNMITCNGVRVSWPPVTSPWFLSVKLDRIQGLELWWVHGVCLPCFRIMLMTLWWFMLLRVNAVGGTNVGGLFSLDVTIYYDIVGYNMIWVDMIGADALAAMCIYHQLRWSQWCSSRDSSSTG